MGTYEGIGLPAYGEFYRYSASGTQNLFVEDDGVWNFTHTSTNTAGENIIALTLTDSATITSGYSQGFYVNHTTSGSYTGGGAQINSIAVDLTLGGTIACEAEGLYIYVAQTGTPTLTSANINGANIYIADLGSQPAARSALQLHIADGNEASGQDAFIVMRLEGASGATTNMFEKAGTATNPTNFLKTNAANNMVFAGDFGTDGASTYGLRCLVAGTTYYIPLIIDS